MKSADRGRRVDTSRTAAVAHGDRRQLICELRADVDATLRLRLRCHWDAMRRRRMTSQVHHELYRTQSCSERASDLPGTLSLVLSCDCLGSADRDGAWRQP